MKFLHLALFLAAYTAAMFFAPLALLADSVPFFICAILSLTLGEICHKRMSTHE